MSDQINGQTYTKPQLILLDSGKQTGSQGTSSSGEESLEAAMAILQAVLSALESDYMRQQSHSESEQIEMGNLLTEATNTESKNKMDNLQDQMSNNSEQTGLQKTFKALEIIGAVVISAVSILLGNPEVAIAIVTMSVLSETGAINKLTGDIAKGFTNLLEKSGMPADTAQKLGNVLAACVVTAVIVIATLGTGAVCGALVSTETLTEDGVAEADNLSTRLSKGAKSASKTALMTGTQALAGTNAIVDIFELAAVNASNPKVKEAMEILGEIVQIVVSIVGMLAGGLGSAPEEAEGLLSKLGDKVSSLSSNIQDLSAKIGEKFAQLDEANLKYLAIASNTAIPGMEAIPSIGMGVTDIELGNLENQLAQVSAGITELKSALQLNQSDLKASQKDAEQILKSFEMLITNVSDYIASMKATTNVLASGI